MNYLQEQYAKAAAKLDTARGEYFKRCEEIEEKYDYEDDAQFDAMCDEQEDVRAEMGIHAMEVKVSELEEALLDDLRKITNQKDMRQVAAMLGTNIEDIKYTLEAGAKLLNTRRKLIDLAMRL
jgi:hypothetical protein